MEFLHHKLMVGKRAFTLVELLVTLSILTLIAGTIHLVFNTAISVGKRGEVDMQVYQDARLAISRMGREISSCLFPESAEDIKFSGCRDSLKFIAVSSSRKRTAPQERRLVEVYYYLENGADTSILRREEKALVGPASGEKYCYTLAEKVTDLNFSYFDGELWTESWEEEEKPPQAVKISLGLKSSKNTAIFRSIVSIPVKQTITVRSEEEISW